MINEAIGILADGVADAEGIDNAMKLGANHPMGPLALGDLIGLDVRAPPAPGPRERRRPRRGPPSPGGFR